MYVNIINAKISNESGAIWIFSSDQVWIFMSLLLNSHGQVANKATGEDAEQKEDFARVPICPTPSCQGETYNSVIFNVMMSVGPEAMEMGEN